MQYIFILFFSLFLLGCNSQQVQTQSKYLSIAKAPLNATEPINISQKIILTFSETLNPNTITKDSIYIDKNNSIVDVNLELLEDNKSVLILPYKFFQPESLYTLHVTTNVASETNLHLKQEYKLNFQTQMVNKTLPIFAVRNKHPEENSTTFPNSEISLDFTRNIALDANFNTLQYLKVVDRNSSKIISGHTEVFNSLLKFIPEKDLPLNHTIDVSLITPVSDIFNKAKIQDISWSFNVAPQNLVPIANQEHKILATFQTQEKSKNVYKIRTLFNKQTSSEVVVATNKSLDLYKIEYKTNFPSKPILSFLGSTPYSKQVTSLVCFNNKYILVGSINGGVDLFEVLNNKFELKDSQHSVESVYGITPIMKDFNDTKKSFIVSIPTFGSIGFDFDPTTKKLTSSKEVSNTIIGETLQVPNYFSSTHSRTIALDYKGIAHIFDENITHIANTTLHGAPRVGVVMQEYGMYQFIIAHTSGKIEKLDEDGALLPGESFDLPAAVKDISIYQDLEMMQGRAYLIPSKGIYNILYGSHVTLIKTNQEIASVTAVYGFNTKLPFLVVANKDATLNLFNASADHDAPSLETTQPQDGDSILKDQNISIYINERYIEGDSINLNNITLYDDNTNENIPFSLKIDTPYTYTTLITLDPDQNLTLDHNYTLTLSKNITDMLNHQLNDGNNTVIHFSVKE